MPDPTHLNLDGTVIRTSRAAAPDLNSADLSRFGKHRHHGRKRIGHLSHYGSPIWVLPVQSGREHDTACARHHGLIDALNHPADRLDVPPLVDLGYENVGDGFHYRSRSRGR